MDMKTYFKKWSIPQMEELQEDYGRLLRRNIDPTTLEMVALVSKDLAALIEKRKAKEK